MLLFLFLLLCARAPRFVKKKNRTISTVKQAMGMVGGGWGGQIH